MQPRTSLFRSSPSSFGNAFCSVLTTFYPRSPALFSVHLPCMHRGASMVFFGSAASLFFFPTILGLQSPA